MNICIKCASRAPDGAEMCETCAPPPPPVEPVTATPLEHRPEGQRFKFVAIDPTDVREEGDAEPPQGLVKAILDHPGAALVIALMLFAVSTAVRRITPTPDRGEVYCATRSEAALRGLLIRPAQIVPDVVQSEGRDIPFREAWVSEVGGWRNVSWIGTEWALSGTGRYRLCFSVDRAVWPQDAIVEAADGRRVHSEPRVADGTPIMLYQVDVPVMNPPLVEFRLNRAGRAPGAGVRFGVH